MSTLTTHSSGTPKPCCERCNSFTPPTCCDLHHPEITANMFDAQVGEMKTKFRPAHAKEHHAKDPAKSAELKEALYKWRVQEFSKRYPDRHDDPWTGDWIILPNKVIVDILYLAHTRKLTTSDKFVQLVDWVHSDRYATELLPIIHAIFPTPTPVATPVSAPDTCAITRVKHCGNCREVGHNGKSSLSL